MMMMSWDRPEIAESGWPVQAVESYRSESIAELDGQLAIRPGRSDIGKRTAETKA